MQCFFQASDMDSPRLATSVEEYVLASNLTTFFKRESTTDDYT